MKFCDSCGKAINDTDVNCPHCGAPQLEGAFVEATVEPAAPEQGFEQAAQEYSQAADNAAYSAMGQQAPPQNGQYGGQYGGPQAANPVDSGSFGWGVLGFCFPIVGLILYLVWKDSKPKSAKVAGLGALISVAVSFVSYLFMGIAGVGASMFM